MRSQNKEFLLGGLRWRHHIISGNTNFGLIMMFTGRWYRPHHLQNVVKNIVFGPRISQKGLKCCHGSQVIGRRLAVYGQKIINIRIFRKKYIISGRTNLRLIMMFTGRYRPHYLQNVVKNIVFEAQMWPWCPGDRP